MSEPTPVQQVVAIARRTPLTRGAVADLAKKVPGPAAAEAALAALETAGVDAALVLAFAAAAAGAKLDPRLTRALLPEVLSLDHVGPLVFATDGAPSALVAGLLEDKPGDLELECLALLVAADALGDAPVPPTLLTRGRWLARHKLTSEASVHLGGAVIRLRDRDLSSLASPHVNRARRAKKTIDEALATARLPPLEVLPDTGGARVSSGYTVRHETPAVGRNDPCPCGSGKKYKKCHAAAETAAPVPAPEAPPPAAALGPDQVALLRPSALAALETARLSPKAFVEAFRRVADFGQWDLALRMVEEARARQDLGKELASDDPVSVLVFDALRGAEDAGAREAAERLHALLPRELAEREAFALECLRGPPDLLARIEREAEAALRADADGGRGMLLASALLRWFPAIGIYVARGALHEARTEDSQALLERIEDARDRLLLSPFEPWWDVYDAFFENSEERREQKKDDARKKKLADDLRRARAASRKYAAEMEKLQKRVGELDAALTTAPVSHRGRAEAPPPAPAPPPADLAEERRRLKTKIDELQRIIGEGQEERRELRRQLAERQEEEPPVSAAPSADADPRWPKRAPSAEAARPRTAREEADAEEALHDAGSVDLPRAVLVPRFSERAAKALADLAGDAADGVLGVVAALAAGKPNAWGGVKQLTKVRGVLSARAGIHHRVLFSIDAGSLEVVEVLHRRDLEQVVARLARTT